MARSRRQFGALLVAAALAGCTALTNDDIELAVENRSNGEQRVVAYVHPPDEARGDPVYEGSLPPGSRVIVGDVTEAPTENEERQVAVEVNGESAQISEVLTVTGPGTIVAMFTRTGVDLEFGPRD